MCIRAAFSRMLVGKASVRDSQRYRGSQRSESVYQPMPMYMYIHIPSWCGLGTTYSGMRRRCLCKCTNCRCHVHDTPRAEMVSQGPHKVFQCSCLGRYLCRLDFCYLFICCYISSSPVLLINLLRVCWSFYLIALCYVCFWLCDVYACLSTNKETRRQI